MKQYSKFFLPLLFLLFLLLFIGCNTDDSDDSDEETSDTDPTISEVIFYKCEDSEKSNPQMSISFNDGDYNYRKIYYRDPDLDIRYIHVTIYIWEDGQYIVYDGPDVSELTSQESEAEWDEDIDAQQIQLQSGIYRYHFQVEDEEDNMSDPFRVNILVN